MAWTYLNNFQNYAYSFALFRLELLWVYTLVFYVDRYKVLEENQLGENGFMSFKELFGFLG